MWQLYEVITQVVWIWLLWAAEWMTASDPHEVLQGPLFHVILIAPLSLSYAGSLVLQLQLIIMAVGCTSLSLSLVDLPVHPVVFCSSDGCF